jgi:hypothetical protein
MMLAGDAQLAKEIAFDLQEEEVEQRRDTIITSERPVAPGSRCLVPHSSKAPLRKSLGTILKTSMAAPLTPIADVEARQCRTGAPRRRSLGTILKTSMAAPRTPIADVEARQCRTGAPRRNSATSKRALSASVSTRPSSATLGHSPVLPVVHASQPGCQDAIGLIGACIAASGRRGASPAAAYADEARRKRARYCGA